MPDSAIDKKQLDLMWDFLQFGKQESNPKLLKEYCAQLKQMMVQKTAGQRKDNPKDIPFSNLSTVLSIIVIETMCLYLSGDLDRLIKEQTNA